MVTSFRFGTMEKAAIRRAEFWPRICRSGLIDHVVNEGGNEVPYSPVRSRQAGSARRFSNRRGLPNKHISGALAGAPGFSVLSGRRALRGGWSQSADCARSADAAAFLQLSLRPCVAGLEVAEVLQAVWSASEHRDVGQANDWKPQCGYSQRTPKLRKSITEKNRV